jgi:hypothetical protein
MTDFSKAMEQAKATMMPFESWEQLKGESHGAFAAFCIFRDYGVLRSIRKALEEAEKDEVVRAKSYRTWYNWSAQFRWFERAADFDRYLEKLKQEERRKTIEAQGEMHRKVTGKMLDVVSKKLDIMNPEELTQGNVTEWVETAIKAERVAAGLASSDKTELKQGELNFVSDFQGL